MKMKNLNKKGFTLIELLAVIVILAIILVIAVPSVLNIQSDAKRGTAVDEAILAIKGYEMCVSAEETPNTCNTAAGLEAYYDNAGGLKKMSVTDGKITEFKYQTNANYCITYTGTGISSTQLRAAIKDANKENKGGVAVNTGACSE